MFKQLIILLLLFLIASNTFGQQNIELEDSLKKILIIHPESDSTKIDLLITQADKVLNSNPSKGIELTKNALQLAEEKKYFRGIAYALRQLAGGYAYLGDYPQSIEYALQALKAGESIKDIGFNASVYNNIGLVYTNMGEYDLSNKYYKLLLDIGVAHKNFTFQGIGYLNIGNNYLDKHDLPNAEKSLAQAIVVAEPINATNVLAYAYSNLGQVFNEKEQFSTAIDYYKKSIYYINQLDGDVIQIQSIEGIGYAYMGLKNYGLAKKYTDSALLLAKEANVLQYQRDAYKILSDIAIAKNDYIIALSDYKNYVLFKDSMVNEDKKTTIATSTLKFEQEKKEALQQAQHTAALNRQSTIKKAIAWGSGILLISAAVSFIFYKRRKEAQFNAQVSDTEMKALRAQMNPHFIFNSLNSIGDYISNNESGIANEYLGKFAKLMRMTLENSERKSVSLADDLKALELYMQLEAKRLNGKFDYKIDIAANIDQENTMVPPMIFQPFVENSIWHGIVKKEERGNILISITTDDKMLHCLIADDGIGRKASSQSVINEEKKSLGMKITKARIDIINRVKKSNATVEIYDLPQGMSVRINLPVELNF